MEPYCKVLSVIVKWKCFKCSVFLISNKIPCCKLQNVPTKRVVLWCSTSFTLTVTAPINYSSTFQSIIMDSSSCKSIGAGCCLVTRAHQTCALITVERVSCSHEETSMICICTQYSDSSSITNTFCSLFYFVHPVKRMKKNWDLWIHLLSEWVFMWKWKFIKTKKRSDIKQVQMYICLPFNDHTEALRKIIFLFIWNL